MNIQQENIDELNAVVTIKVGPEDYDNQYEKAVKKVQQQVAMPGFRPGKVPNSLVKKKYGKSILLEELNKVLSESLNNYISENKLEILGHPLAKTNQDNLDLDNQKEFSFSFDLGLAPQINVEVSSATTMPYSVIKVDDELVEKYVKDVRKNNGKPINPEVAGDKDVLFLDIVQLDENGTILPGGIFKSTSIGIERLKNDAAKAKLTGLKKEDKVVVNIKELYETPVEMNISLGVDKTAAETLDCNLQLTVKNIARLEDAEMNQELFDKIYGEGVVTTEEDFRKKIGEELAVMFSIDADKKFFGDVQEKLLNENNVQLPDEFLKRWLLTANDKTVTIEQIENDYENWSRMMKWKLIEGKVARNFELKVTAEEMKEETARFVIDQYRKYGQHPDEKELDKMVHTILAKEDEARKIADNIMDRKLLVLFKSTFTLENKEVAYDEFFGLKK
ncbi:MAG: trigger factor [Bacteroidia bacterium]|nr:trigger factor [Bacteroidia bacterium]